MRPPLHYPLSEPITIGTRAYSANQVINHLAPLLTENRIQRVDEVIAERTFNVCTVLEKLYDRGNVSAVIRSAEAFGFASVNIIELEDKFKVANRVTKGSDKWMAIQRWQSTQSCVENLKAQGYRLAVTTLNAPQTIDELDFTQRTAVVFGSEAEGVSPEMAEAADITFKYPMHGFTGSFNISVAAALCLSKIHHQRRQKLGTNGDLPDTEKRLLRAHYYIRTVDQPHTVLRRIPS